MIKRILLIDVDNETFKQSYSRPSSQMSHYPIGLMYLASSVKKKLDLEIKIFHTKIKNDPIEELEALITDFSPDLIGLRALSICQDYFKIIAKNIRKQVPNIYIIGGGPYPSTDYINLLQKKIVDIVAIGEGEETFVEIAECLNKNYTLPHNIIGTAVLKENAVFVNKMRPSIKDINSIPFPDYDTIDLKDYSKIFDHSCRNISKTALICSSRGCPYNCFYCHQLFGKKIRRRSAENIVAEMKEHITKRNLFNFVFVDDIFNVPIKNAKELLRLIIKELPAITINFPNGLRADQMDNELIDLFEEAGTQYMALAIETANNRLQKLIGKNLNVEKSKDYIDKASRRFIMRAFFMIGFPTETYKEALETINFAKELEYVTEPLLSIVRIYKGTKLFDLLNPNEKQIKILEKQEKNMIIPKLLDKTFFYGDLFSKEIVPLRSKDIQKLRWEWGNNIYYNKNRIINSYNVLNKFFTKKEILEYYHVSLNDPTFNEKNLNRLLKMDNTKP